MGILWIEHHGFECLLLAFLFSLVTSVMPPLPAKQGFWATWLYNIIQVLGANAGNLVKNTPAGKQIESLTGTKTLATSASGASVETTQLAATSTTLPKE